MSTKASRGILLALFLASILAIALNVTSALARSSDIVIAVGGSTPTIDGSIEDREWDDSSIITISVTGGANCTVYAKQDGTNLYVGFSIPDAAYNVSDCCVILFDVNHDGSASLQADDMWLAVSREGVRGENNVTADGWYPTSLSGWTAEVSSTATGWQSEYNIPYSKLDVTAGAEKTLGLDLLVVDHDVEKGWYTWPSPWISEPASWGDLASNEYDWQAVRPADTTQIWIIAAILIIGVGAVLLIYFSRTRK